jgi:hypothetical protein
MAAFPLITQQGNGLWEYLERDARKLRGVYEPAAKSRRLEMSMVNINNSMGYL